MARDDSNRVEVTSAPYTVDPLPPGPDPTPPVIDNFQPVPPTTIAFGDSVSVDITEETNLAGYQVFAEYPNQTELVIEDGVFSPNHNGTVVPAGNTITITMNHDVGWQETPLVFRVVARDDFNRVEVSSDQYTVDPLPPGVDPTPPVIDNWTPPGGVVPSTQTISVDVTENESLEHVWIFADYVGFLEVVWNDGVPGSGYNVVTSNPGAGVTRYTMTPDVEWKAVSTTLQVIAQDTQNQTSGSQAYTIDPPPTTCSGDTTPPVVDNFSPPPGTPIESDTPISFDVTDDSGIFSKIFVMAIFDALGDWEVIWDGSQFSDRYLSSGRVGISGGFRYTVERTGGWPADLLVRVCAIDQCGNTDT